ncbi:MAG: hypothetical protein NTX25_20660, partial [Proteobacteria bacterium]|nr:hypothetical protein [Pseudomonadota bacterium]
IYGSVLAMCLSLSLWSFRAEGVPANILNFQASTYQIDTLQPVRLTWTVRNSVRVDVYDGFRSKTYDNLGESNYIEVWPEKTAVFTLLAYGSQGEVEQRSLTIVWSPVHIEYFRASSTSIDRVQAVRLSWKVSSARQVDIYDGFKNTTYTNLGNENYIEVWPEATATYTLRVYGQGQPLEQQITIKFEQDLPNIRVFSASVQALEIPRTIYLSWQVDDASSIAIYDMTSGQRYEGLAAAGLLEILPKQTTRYILIAKGLTGNQVQRELLVTVLQAEPKILYFRTNADLILPQQEVRIEWRVEPQAFVRVYASPLSTLLFNNYSTMDSLVLRPERSADYVLQVFGPSGTTWQTVSLHIEVAGSP